MGSGIPIKFCRALKMNEVSFELLRRNLPFEVIPQSGITFAGKITSDIKPNGQAAWNLSGRKNKIQPAF